MRTLVPLDDPRAHALLSLLLALPFLPGLPLPGLSAVCGVTIAIAGTRLALGLPVWVPERWLDRPIAVGRLGAAFAFSGRMMARLETVIRPRLAAIAAHPWTLRANGAAIAVCGLLIAVPFLPSLANIPPAAAVTLLSLASLEADSLALAAGWSAFALNAAAYVWLWHAGAAGLRALFA